MEEAEVSYWKLLVELKAIGVLKKRFSCDDEGPRVLKKTTLDVQMPFWDGLFQFHVD